MKGLPKRNVWIIIILSIIILLGGIFIITCQKGKTPPTDSIYPINKNGQTYGSAMYANNESDYPDLILAVGDDWKTGYVTQADFLGQNKDDYEQYEKTITNEAMIEHYRKEFMGKYENYKELTFYQICYDIPLYDKDGEEIIGKMVMVIDTLPYE